MNTFPTFSRAFRARADKRWAVCAAVVLCLLAPATSAQETIRSSPVGGTTPHDYRIEDGKLIIGLEEAVILALRNNLGLKVNRYRRSGSYESIRRAQGVFDLGLGVNLNGFSETSPAATALEGADVREFEGQNFDLSLDQLISSGGVVRFDWTNARQETNSAFASVNPSYGVDFDVTFNQPLLQGLGSNVTKRNILIARGNSDISLETLRLQIIDTIRLVEDTYWTLVESLLQLEVAIESQGLAENLHANNKIQVEVGTLPPLELTQSEVRVATREEAVLRARGVADDTADRLRQLLNIEDERLWAVEIQPSTDPRIDPVALDVEQGISTALANRAELYQQRLAINNLEIDHLFAKNGVKPRLDLQMRYGYNGLGGDVLIDPDIFDPTNPTMLIPGGVVDALEQIADRLFDGWSAGLQFSYPIQNRAGKASLAIADLALEEGEAILEDLELAIMTEVRRTHRGVEVAAEAIALATVSRELEEKNLDAEEKKYENGLSTSFQVLEIQEDLSAARSREVSSITSYRRSLALYFQAIGQLLEENGIDLEDDVVEEE